MTREEAHRILSNGLVNAPSEHEWVIAFEIAIKALEEPCEDAISRREVLEIQTKYVEHIGATKFWQMRDDIKGLPSVTPQPKIGYCKDCKWQKDSDGAFRRGVGAESQCPINRIEVYDGNGYCFMFKPQESEE